MRRAAGVALAACLGIAQFARAQAIYTAEGPGSYTAVGGAVSGFQSDYGKSTLGGGTVYLDSHLYRRIGAETELRTLRFHSDDGQRQTTLLTGPKLSARGRDLRPYAKFLAGRGWFTFPYRYATGSYFVMAPGAGLDWRLPHSRVIVRVVDAEYQLWPGFTFGPLHPFGVSSGVALRVF